MTKPQRLGVKLKKKGMRLVRHHDSMTMVSVKKASNTIKTAPLTSGNDVPFWTFFWMAFGLGQSNFKWVEVSKALFGHCFEKFTS